MSNGEYYDEELHDESLAGFHEVDDDDDYFGDDEDHAITKKKTSDDDEDLDVLLNAFETPEEDEEFNPDVY
jgi:hypothetical protein